MKTKFNMPCGCAAIIISTTTNHVCAVARSNGCKDGLQQHKDFISENTGMNVEGDSIHRLSLRD